DWICKMDTKGNIIYYKYVEQDAYDFRREVLADGTSYYCYRQTISSTQGSMYLHAATGRAFAKEVIMDQNYNVVKEVQGLTNHDGTLGLPLDNHDFLMIDLNHYICMSYVPKYVNNIPDGVESNRIYQSRVLATVIQEVKDNNVVFEWDSTKDSELYDLSVEGNIYANNTRESQWADYMHCNSMDLDIKDNNLLLSFRNLNAIMKIDRKSGEIIWILGGKGDMFGLTDEQKFNRQHFARYTEDGSITLFDNSTNYSVGGGEYYGNGTGVPRGLEFYLDESNHKVISWKAYDYGMPQAEIMGSAQKLDENKMLLGWGWSMKVPSYAMFSEIDSASHTTLFECSSDIQQNMTYRVYKDIQ
ncbi:MAG: arylsulfotransferase family protein, partial [Hungatella sp.]